MKNRIDLYQPQFKPKVILLSLNFAFLIWFLALVSIVVAGVSVSRLKNHAQQEVLFAAQQVKDKTTLLGVMTKGRDSRVQNPKLVEALEQSQKQLKIKKTIVRELANREQQKSQGFSALMLDLAANHQQDLWLTEIHLNESQISIRGGATDSAAVPNWVNKLASAEYFIGKEFAAARLYRDGNEELLFVLSSEIADLGAGVTNEQ